MPAPNIDGFWIKELDSVMELKLTGLNVSGTYKTAVGDASNQQQGLDLSGILHYPLITFFVNFSTSICTWMGIFEELKPDGGQSELVLHTVWLLGSIFQDLANTQPTKIWNTFQVNRNTFKRIPATTLSTP